MLLLVVAWEDYIIVIVSKQWFFLKIRYDDFVCQYLCLDIIVLDYFQLKMMAKVDVTILILVLLSIESAHAWFWKPCRQYQEGGGCSVFCPCQNGMTCAAVVHKCRRSANLGESCHLTRPCRHGLSCQPGAHRCYHVPRQLGEPCSAGYSCAHPFYCQGGFRRCRRYLRRGEYCNAASRCESGLTCVIDKCG